MVDQGRPSAADSRELATHQTGADDTDADGLLSAHATTLS
jgi:hypothetical protein